MNLDEHALKQYKILIKQGIPKKERKEIFRGFGDPELIEYGYDDEVNRIINYVSLSDLRGKAAVKYISKEIQEWGEKSTRGGIIFTGFYLQ